jgi:hypothetical protein
VAEQAPGYVPVPNQLLDISSFMDTGVVHDDNRTRRQLTQQVFGQESLKILSVHRSQLTLGTDHPQTIKSADHREIFAPLGGNFLDQILSFFAPTVEQTKGKRDPHFIKKNQLIGVKCLYLLPEFGSFLCVSLQGDFAFFLKLKRSCLSTLVAVDMEIFCSPFKSQASASASAVQSFLERTSSSNSANFSCGTRLFRPGVGLGCRLSPKRFLVASLFTLESETANLCATDCRLAPVSKAVIMRCLRSVERGFIPGEYLKANPFDEDYNPLSGTMSPTHGNYRVRQG